MGTHGSCEKNAKDDKPPQEIAGKLHLIQKYYQNNYNTSVVELYITSLLDSLRCNAKGDKGTILLKPSEPQMEWEIIEACQQIIGKQGTVISPDTVILPGIRGMEMLFDIEFSYSEKQKQTIYQRHTFIRDSGFITLQDFEHCIELANPLKPQCEYLLDSPDIKKFDRDILYITLNAQVWFGHNFIEKSLVSGHLKYMLKNIKDEMKRDQSLNTVGKKEVKMWNRISELDPFLLEEKVQIVSPLSNEPMIYEDSEYVHENFSLWNGWTRKHLNAISSSDSD